MANLRVRVTREGQLKAIELNADAVVGQDLLSSVEAKGISLPFGCRAGACGACVVKVEDPKNSLEPPSPIEKDTLSRGSQSVDSGFRLACRARWSACAADQDLQIEVPQPPPSDSDWPY